MRKIVTMECGCQFEQVPPPNIKGVYVLIGRCKEHSDEDKTVWPSDAR